MNSLSRYYLIGFLMLALASPTSANAQWYQGPSGGTGGYKFDEWVESGNARRIDNIGIIEKDGGIQCFEVWSYRPQTGDVKIHKYGSCVGWVANANGQKLQENFRLDKDEYLLGVAGGFDGYIKSIQFWTNKRASPKYGGDAGKYRFGYTAPSGQMIVAFIGRSGGNLDSLGVMYAPCDTKLYSCK